MAIWSLASAPLLMSNDLASVPAASRAILLNAEVLAIDQDPLGRMCFRYLDDMATTVSRKAEYISVPALPQASVVPPTRRGVL